MSSYYDQKSSELRTLQGIGCTVLDGRVRSWVRTLQLDHATCCEFDRTGPLAFPVALRDRVYELFLQCWPDAWPAGVSGYGVDYEHDAQGMALLHRLVEGLHDLFHAAATDGWPGRDNPLSAVQAMDCRMEERCAELIAQNPGLDLRQPVSEEKP